MSTWQIIVIVALGTGVWILYKRFTNNEYFGENWCYPPQQDVENWYRDAQADISGADEQELLQRVAAWEAMNKKERLAFSNDFILSRFGQRAISGYNLKQRLQIGKAYHLTKPEQ
jgi:hypothetical protein